jgi:group I intron endonuclease
MVGIYKITNPKGKIYVGQSVNVDIRFRSHKNSYYLNNGTKLQNSFKKYGYSSHKFEILVECEIDKLNELERFYQEKYDTVNKGLNLCYTTTETKSGKVAEEVKLKIKAANTGRIFSSEHREKLKKAKEGIVWAQETLDKRAKSMTGKNTVKVKCLNDGIIFNSIKEATEFYSLKYRSYIENVCAGRKAHIKKLIFEKI